MADFLYFVEGSPGNRESMIKEHHLGYALDTTCTLQPITLGVTPSGKPGCILGKQDSRIGYRADDQEWQQYKNHWVGFWKDDPPKPEDLERPSTIPGYEIELGDGYNWRIPLARQFMQDGTAGSQLPHKLKVNPSGDWVLGDVHDRYRSVWDLSVDFFDQWHEKLMSAIEDGEDSFGFDYADPQSSAAKMLATNYEVSDIEVSLLGLFLSDDTAGKIMRAACNCDLAMVWILDAKKNEPVADGSPTDDGAEDLPAITPQLLPT